MEKKDIIDYFDKYSKLFTVETFYALIFRLAKPKTVMESLEVERLIINSLSYSKLRKFANPTRISAEPLERWSKKTEKNLKIVYRILKEDFNIKIKTYDIVIHQLEFPENKYKFVIEKLKYYILNKQTQKNIKKRKADGNYNDDHRLEKYAFNREILKHIRGDKIDTILDLFGGPISFYKNSVETQGLVDESVKIISNDIKFEGHDYQMNAKDLINKFKAEGRTFDYIDADPFGNIATHCAVEDLVSLANKYIIFTCCHCCRHESLPNIKQNWNFAKYGVAPRKLKESFIEKLIEYMSALGKYLKKDIQPIMYISWKGSQGFRIAFKINPIREE